MKHRDKNIAFVQRFMHHVWQDKRYHEVGEFLSPQLIVESPLRTCVGSQNLSNAFSVWLQAFPDLQYHEQDVSLYGDWVKINWMCDGDHLGEFFGLSATGKKITYCGSTMVLMSDGIIHSYRADVSLPDVLERISGVPQNGPSMASQPSDDMFAHFNRITGAQLSRRQIECLSLVCLGNNNKTIAAMLGIQYSTFRTHIERALPLLGLSSPKQVFDWAFSTHVLELLIHIGLRRIRPVHP
ncbi:SnoaL-like polyketide cyclase [Vibrio aerogenes CECT 7868]|uniref:SnoaL-like polyketide cyclase n=1 Tax=Vibrio aerogenes CECT 7868 TaxID=1216006 RepID=A0A1M6AZA9_9VIBR|nr:ester cyclase [Vibrio aerogenes]SHI41771.1 SnoaL-like polyketide cyclase [Vibrio aerogenes CECT 7868]